MNEKRNLMVRRLIWLGIVVVIVLLLIVTGRQPKVEILDINLDCEYSSYSDKSDVTITMKFNTDVESDYATVRFYDAAGNLLATDDRFFTASHGDQTARNYTFSVDGDVVRCEITSHFKPYSNNKRLRICLASLALTATGIFLSTFFLFCKEKEFNGTKISVYVGRYHHNLRVNGQIRDEYNAFFFIPPLQFSTTLDDGTKVEATIITAYRISIKVNGELI